MRVSQPRRYLSLCELALVAALLFIGCGRSEAPRIEPESSSVDEDPAVVIDTPSVEPAVVDTVPAPVTESRPVDPAQLREDAIDALDARDLDEAFRLVRAAKAAAPEDDETTFVMARVLAERNRFAEAIKMLDDLAEDVPEARLPVLGQTAEWSVFQGEWQQAEGRYRAILSEVGPEPMVHRLLAQLLLRQGRRLEAAQYLQQLCNVGDLDESEMRSLLTLAYPFAGEPAEDELAPIGALGEARYLISQGSWSEASQRLEQIKSPSPAEAALLGRIYAEQEEDESLNAWAAEFGDPGEESSDYWFAMGVTAARGDDHTKAVSCFCQAVLLDETDHRAYQQLSESLAAINEGSKASEATRRAALIKRTQEIGREMAASDTRDLEAITKLADLLDELQRPLEALAWRAVQVYYGQASSALAAPAANAALAEINRNRTAQLKSFDAEAKKKFLLCGIDLETLAAEP